MLPKAHRLTRSEIELIIKNGKSVFSSLFSGKMTKSKTGSLNEGSKVAFVASKKLFPKAVTRNKVKRQARESFRDISTGTKGVSAVIFLKKEVLNFKKTDLSVELLKALSK